MTKGPYRAAWRRYFQDFDVFLSPVSRPAAPPHDDRPFAERTVAGRPYTDQSFWIAQAALPGLPALSAPAGRPPTACRSDCRSSDPGTSTRLSPRQAGVALRGRLEERGWQYSDGRSGPPEDGRWCCECYPYTTLVGAPELGYETERPRYKRKPRAMPAGQWRPIRQAACDDLIRRLARLAHADPPLRLDSYPVTRQLAAEPSPLNDTAYKHREDLIDALLCAWTAALWFRHGGERCQVLGPPAGGANPSVATIIAPARPEQRR